MSSLSVTNTTLLITWDPPLAPSSDILVYEVRYQREGGQEGGGVVNVTATSVELTGLRPESTYTISVRAYTAAGPGEERRLTVAAATTNTSQLLDQKVTYVWTLKHRMKFSSLYPLTCCFTLSQLTTNIDSHTIILGEDILHAGDSS